MKVTMNESEVTNKTEQMQVIDSRGRVLKLRKLDILSESRLVRMLGQEAVTNQIYMNAYVLPAAMVSEIDGEAVFTPTSQREMEALIQRLDNVGIGAILEYLQKQSQELGESEEQLKN